MLSRVAACFAPCRAVVARRNFTVMYCTDALSALDDDYAGLRCFARQIIAEKSDDSDDLGSEVNR